MEQANLDDLYGGKILEHCRNPRNHDALTDPDASAHTVNPFCGDESDVQITLNGDRIVDVGAQATGCYINQATTSMLAQAANGISLDTLSDLLEVFRRQMNGDALSDEDLVQLGDLATLSGVLRFPVRIKCTLLSLSTMEEVLDATGFH